MNRVKNSIIAISMSMLFTGSLLAQSDRGQQGNMGGEDMSQNPARQRQIEPKPMFSDEQQEQLSAYRLELTKQTTPLQAEIEVLEAELKQASVGDDASIKNVNKYVDQINTKRAELAKLKYANKLKVRSVLTDEQKQMADEHRAKRPDFRGEQPPMGGERGEFAQGNRGDNGRQKGPDGERGPKQNMKKGNNAQGPMFTDEQREQFKGYRAELTEEVNLLKADIDILEAQLNKEMMLEDSNVKDVNKLIDQISEKRADISKAQFASRFKMRSMLTDEQKVFFDASSLRKPNFREGRRPGRGGENGRFSENGNCPGKAQCDNMGRMQRNKGPKGERPERPDREEDVELDS